MHAKIAKIFLKLLKNPTTRKYVLGGLGIFLLITTVAPVATGMTALYGISRVISSVIEAFTDDNDSVDLSLYTDEDELLKIINENGLTSNQEANLRMKTDDFKHLLERVSEYNHAGERSRTISVECEIETTDEDGNTIVETEYKDVTVDNSHYEGLYKLDYRIFYYFCILSTAEKDKADKILDYITPLDKDFNEITEFTNQTGADDLNFVSSERIDKIFTYVTTQYTYEFDVLRDEKTSYSMSEARSLPHRTEEWTDGDANYTMYVPQTYLRYGSSAYSYISNEMDGRTLTGTKEHFSYDSLLSSAKGLFPKLTENMLELTFKFGELDELFFTYKGYGTDTVVAEINGLSITTTGTSGNASFKGLNSLSQEAIETLTYIYNKMLEWGWTPEMAAGACGNAWQENWFKVEADKKGKAHGIFQWQDGRWNGASGLKNFAESQGKAWNTVDVQVDFLYKELTSSGYLSKIDQYLSTYYNGATTSTIDDIDAATDAFCVKYEGCYCTDSSGNILSSHLKYHNSQCAKDKSGRSWQHLQQRRDYALAIYNAMSLVNIDSESKLSGEEIDKILDLLPDNLSDKRRQIVEYALGSVGRIPYYYGDSTSKPGYDNQRFGQAAASSDAYYEKNAGKGRYVHGLDCSGWISWVYLSTIERPYMGDTRTLSGLGKSINRTNLLPGDILVKAGSHVVMYLGRNADGSLVVIHENASAKNVSISWNWNISAYQSRNILGD